MKIKNILMTAAIALVGVASANAATTTYTSGDIILGFSQTGDGASSYCYEINIGSASQFMNLSGGTTITFQLSATDLSTIFGTNWNSDASVSFGLAGAGTVATSTVLGQVAGTTWVSAPTGTTLTTVGSNAQTQEANSIITMTIANTSAGSFKGQTTYGSVSNATQILASGANSWATKADTNGDVGASFQVFSNGVYTSLGDGDTASVDFYQTSGSAVSQLGTFTLSDSGVLTFEAVPEPSTYAMLGLGGLGMLRMFRRRRA